MLIVSLALAVAMLAFVGIAYRSGTGAVATALLVTGIFTFFGTMSAVLLGTWLLVSLIAIVCRSTGASTKKFAAWSTAAAILTHSIAAILLIPPTGELLELRREYPIESLRHRLAYEQRALDAIDVENHAIALSKPPNVRHDAEPAADVSETLHQDDRLAQLEDQLDRRNWNDARLPARYRTTALHRLYQAHESAVAEFINSAGFGVGRMAARATPTRKNIELPPISPVPQPLKTHQRPLPSGDDGTPPLQAAHAEPQDTSAMRNSLASLHLDGTVDFANPIGFGYVRDLDHAIGFQPHAFSQLPQMSENNSEATHWSISKLELVSLLKHEQAQVYQSKNLPNMQELEAVPTRSLDGFESAALNKLRGGEDLIVSTDAHEIRMLGSLRAAKQCMECHQVDRGTLLGAFTYRLVSDAPADQPKAEKVPRKPAS